MAVLAEAATADPSVWGFKLGDQIERLAIHDRYGGRLQSGIGPSSTSPNVFLFADPIVGERHGNFDGWRADGCFHFTGEGQRGDQQMKSGNASILNHEAEGRALRLFLGARGLVTYQGEFGLADDRPFYTTDAPEIGDGPVRTVIVFRLRPLDLAPRPSSSKLDQFSRRTVENVSVEDRWTEQAFVAPSHGTHEADKREHALVLAYCEQLVREGHEMGRLKIIPQGEAKPLFCDLIDHTTNTLIEAKGTVQRGAIRTAIGQLMDYRRFVDPSPQMALLLPSQPREDLLQLLASVGVQPIWKDGGAFIDGNPLK